MITMSAIVETISHLPGREFQMSAFANGVEGSLAAEDERDRGKSLERTDVEP